MSWFGINKFQMNKLPDGTKTDDITDIGYKYQMNDLNAAILYGNLDDIPIQFNHRTRIAQIYLDGLKNIDGLRLPTIPHNTRPSWFFFSLRVQNRDRFVDLLRRHDIPCSVADRRIDRHTIFKPFIPKNYETPNLDKFDIEHIAIPTHFKITEEFAHYICYTIKQGW